MILYQDTDSICKRFLLDEEGIEDTQFAVERADRLATAQLSYAEVRAAFARARRGARLGRAAYDRLVIEFEDAWDQYVTIAISERLIHAAGELAASYFLRGMDAIQLAAAITLRSAIAEEIAVSTWDRRSGLVSAFVAEGFVMAH